ncbi:MAG TPA: glycosyltransferase [Candidatus Udaeobacter sp.]|nr:glycosyltransferase [Candidatus Udaeobacter sp.]
MRSAVSGLTTPRDKRIRVFYLSYNPPVPSWGTAMSFYRHFVERSDFEIFIATDSMELHQYEVPYRFLRFDVPKWLKRMQRTRFYRWFWQYNQSIAGYFVPHEVWKAAQSFNPDLVFTIAGSWNWTARLAQRVARRLRVPVVASFNDWYDFGVVMHPRFRRSIERAFRKFYRDCDLAFCTSEGMLDALGSHPNAHVLYPTGASMSDIEHEFIPFTPDGSPATVFFAGSLSAWYGPMLEQLVRASSDSALRFAIFGSHAHASWSRDFDSFARTVGVYKGQVPFDQLRTDAQEADLLLLPMGFGDECAQTERTSFKTKFLDYLTFQKPIIIWGPDYCSAIRAAREFDAAECYTSPDAAGCIATLGNVARSPERQKQLVANARRMYHSRFEPSRIHAVLLREFEKLVRLQRR